MEFAPVIKVKRWPAIREALVPRRETLVRAKALDIGGQSMELQQNSFTVRVVFAASNAVRCGKRGVR